MQNKGTKGNPKGERKVMTSEPKPKHSTKGKPIRTKGKKAINRILWSKGQKQKGQKGRRKKKPGDTDL